MCLTAGERLVIQGSLATVYLPTARDILHPASNTVQ